MTIYDWWADIYDGVTAQQPLTQADVPFWVDEAVKSGGPVLELACGTGRVAIPVAQAGIDVVGLDHSQSMLAVARRKAEAAGLPEGRLLLVEGDMRDFALGRRFPLAIIPYRAFLHMYTVEDQKRCLAAIAARLAEGGRLIIDIFNPNLRLLAGDLTRLAYTSEFTHAETGRRVLVWESRRYDHLHQLVHNYFLFQEMDEDGLVVRQQIRPLTVRYLFRYEAQHLFEGCGYEVEALYGWFDRRPFDEKSEEMVWVLRRG